MLPPSPLLHALAIPFALASADLAQARTDAAVDAFPTERVAPARMFVRDHDPRDLRLGADSSRHERLLQHVREHAASFGLSELGPVTLRAEVRVSLSRPDLEIVLVRGEVDGVPLLVPVARALVDVAAGGRVARLTGERPWPAMSPTRRVELSAADAVARLTTVDWPGMRGAKANTAELVAVAWRGETRVVWRIDPPIDLPHATNPVYWVDAQTGDIALEQERVKMAKVRAFEHNPVASPVADNYDLLHHDGGDTLVGPYFRAISVVPGGEDHTAIADDNGDFLYPEPDVTVPEDNIQPDDPFAEVQMYYHVEKFHEWLVAQGFPGLLCHVSGDGATLVANYRQIQGSSWQPFDNAFYGGDCDATMVFGQGSEVDFAYDGDVVAHEYGHGVVEKQAPNGLGGAKLREDARIEDAGAINEAVADFFSAVFHGDSAMADYVSQYWSVLDSDSMRELDNTHRCPHDMVGEVHLDSTPVSGMMWEAHQAIGDDLATVILDSLTMVSSDADVEEFAAAVVAVGDTVLDATGASTLRSIVEARGLLACHRVAPWNEQRRPLYVRASAGVYTPYAPPPVQLELDVPANQKTLTLTFTALHGINSVQGVPGGDVKAGVVVKRGSPMAFKYAGNGPYTVDAGTDEDYLNLASGEVSIAVEGGEKLYLAFVNTGSDRMRLEDLKATFSEVGGDDDDAGDDDDDDDDGDTGTGTGTGGGDDDDDDDDTAGGDDDGDDGCGCASASGSSPVWAWLGLGLAVGLRRRRRVR